MLNLYILILLFSTYIRKQVINISSHLYLYKSKIQNIENQLYIIKN